MGSPRPERQSIAVGGLLAWERQVNRGEPGMGRREKPLDPAAGVVQSFAHALRKLRAEAGAPTYRVMARRAGYSGPTLSAAAAGERLPTLPVLRAYVTACGGDPEEWTRRWHEAVAESAEPAGQDDAGSPYPGLARFDTADRDHFHGRAELVAELLELTARRRVSAVVGASGSGKSSLLRAGLIPAVRETDAPGPPIPAVRETDAPGPPIPALREADAPAQRPAAIRVLTPGAHPDRTHAALFTPHPGPGDTLLVVDQFEEVFALCADAAERERFVRRLLTALDPAHRLRVVLAVRADFYGRCADHGPLADALRDSTLLVGPMAPAQLREAVVRPAAARRLVVERALTARIVADVAGEPGGLPLMAHALREVWRRRTGKTLTLAAYESVGGVRGAVAHTAEALHADCAPAEQAAVRALLLRLVNPGDGTADTRRPVDRAELGSDPLTAQALERLVRARLLTVDGDTVDLAHEALIAAWPRLRGWVEDNRERLRAHRRLTQAARAWAELARDEGALYRGVRLTEARELFGGAAGELTAPERDFLAASVEAHERGLRAAARATRRLRALTGGLAALLCLAVLAGAVAWRQGEVSAQRRDEAEARRVAALSDTLRATEPRTAMRLALAAWHTADLPETRQALRTAAAQSERDAFTLPEDGGRAVNAPAWLSRDGRVLTSVAHDRAVQWDVPGHRRLRTDQRRGLSAGVVDVSADGRQVAYWGPGRRELLIGDLARGGTRSLTAGPATDTDGAFGPSGHTFVVRRLLHDRPDARSVVEVWDIRRNRLLIRHTRPEDGGPLPLLSHDDRRLAWCTDTDSRLHVLDVTTARPVPTRMPRATERALCQAEELTFTPDGRAVAAATADGVVTWDVGSGRERPRLPVAGGALAVDFSGAYALTWSSGALSLWRTDTPPPADGGPREPLLTHPVAASAIGDIRLDAAAGALRYRESGRTSTVRTLSLHGLTGEAWHTAPATAATRTDTVAADPARRVALTSEGTLRDLATGGERDAVTGEDYLVAGDFSPDGRRLAVSDTHGRVTLWDTRTWRRIAVLRAVDPSTDRPVLAFSADGALLAVTASDGSVRVWETASPGLPAAVLPVGDGPVLRLEFTGSGDRLSIGTSHLTARSREMNPDRAAAVLCDRAGGGPTEAEWRRHVPSAPYRDVCGP